MEQFEYKIINISRTKLKKEAFQTEVMDMLNDLGAQGWEIITVEGLNEGNIWWRVADTVDLLFLLKRRI